MAALAAAVLILGLIAVPAVSSRHRAPLAGGAGAPSPPVVLDAVERLRMALAQGDPAAVQQADAELQRLVASLKGADRQAVQEAANQVHRAALDFLRANPPPAGVGEPPAASGPQAGKGGPAGSGPGPPASPPPTPKPEPPPVAASPAPGSVPPTGPNAAGQPTVHVVAVTAPGDGTLLVVFTATGFTPDLSGDPGSVAVRFTFDGGQEPLYYGGPSPWLSPPLGRSVHRVCAEVVDASRQPLPGSGDCQPVGP